MSVMARLAACLLVMSLTGPSLLTLACEWTCAAHHQAAAPADMAGCHEHHQESGAPAFASVDVCHDLLSGEVMLRPVLQDELEPAIARSSALVQFEPPGLPDAIVPARLRPPATSGVTPPLRI
jgi:hypothetical protein